MKEAMKARSNKYLWNLALLVQNWSVTYPEWLYFTCCNMSRAQCNAISLKKNMVPGELNASQLADE
jgi:hypothetical protein